MSPIESVAFIGKSILDIKPIRCKPLIDYTKGLGVMGYGMAVNLRSKLDKSIKFYVCDISQETIKRFESELDGYGPIEVVQNGAEAVQTAVSHSCWQAQVSY